MSNGFVNIAAQRWDRARRYETLAAGTAAERRASLERAIQRKFAHEEAQKQRAEQKKGMGWGAIGTLAGGAIAAPFTGGMSLAGAAGVIGAGMGAGGAVGSLFDSGGGGGGMAAADAVSRIGQTFSDWANAPLGGLGSQLHGGPSMGTPGQMVPGSVTQEALRGIGQPNQPYSSPWYDSPQGAPPRMPWQ